MLPEVQCSSWLRINHPVLMGKSSPYPRGWGIYRVVNKHGENSSGAITDAAISLSCPQEDANKPMTRRSSRVPTATLQVPYPRFKHILTELEELCMGSGDFVMDACSSGPCPPNQDKKFDRGLAFMDVLEG